MHVIKNVDPPQYAYDEIVNSSVETLEDGVVVYRDLSYDSEYPNNYLDIYLLDSNIDTPRATLFNIHGGGLYGEINQLILLSTI